MMEWTGGCLCGSIRYRASEAPQWAAHCHCGMCRKLSGAPFCTFVEFPAGIFEWTQGKPAQYQSSNRVIRGFCPNCGSTLTYEPDELFFISLGSLDQPEHVQIESHCYTKSQLPFIKLADGLPHYPGPRGGKGGRPG
jgi:hypothetical protein